LILALAFASYHSISDPAHDSLSSPHIMYLPLYFSENMSAVNGDAYALFVLKAGMEELFGILPLILS
jgi:hypothetical protein